MGTTRRQYGTGSLIQRADGKWLGRIDAGYTPSGTRRVRSVVRATKAEARQALREIQRSLDTDDSTAIRRTSVKTWAEQWLELRAERMRPASYNADRSAITQWIIPTIGKRSLDALTPADIRKVHTAMRKAGRADSSITRAHATLIKMLKDAWQDGHQVPARALQAPPPATGTSERTDIPVDDAIKLIQAAADDPLRSRWVAALMQGMRQAECMGLAWDRVDFDAETIDVSYQLKPLPYEHGCGGTCGLRFGGNCPERRFRVPHGYRHEQIEGRWHLVPPKTRAGERVIPMLPWMKAALQERREAMPGARLVWENPDGSIRDEKQDSREWKALQDKAGVSKPDGSYYDLHECRHATATILLALGIDPVIVIAIMGHSSIASTRRYQHADLVMMRKALEGVADTLQLTT